MLQASFRNIFEGEGNGRWARLSSETIRWRQRIKPPADGKPILNVSGRMKNSVLGGRGYIEKSTTNRLEIGTNNPIAHLHQFGGEVSQPLRSKKAKKAYLVAKDAKGASVVKRIPARPFMTAGGTISDPDLDETTKGQVAETFAEAISRKILEAVTGALSGSAGSNPSKGAK